MVITGLNAPVLVTTMHAADIDIKPSNTGLCIFPLTLVQNLLEIH